VAASSAATNLVGSGILSVSDSGPAGSAETDSARVRRAKVTQNRMSLGSAASRHYRGSRVPSRSERPTGHRSGWRPGTAISPIPAVRISGRNVPDWLLIQQYEYSATLPPQSRPFDANSRSTTLTRRGCVTSGQRKGSVRCRPYRCSPLPHSYSVPEFRYCSDAH
jgi:hypothetical protein